MSSSNNSDFQLQPFEADNIYNDPIIKGKLEKINVLLDSYMQDQDLISSLTNHSFANQSIIDILLDPERKKALISAWLGEDIKNHNDGAKVDEQIESLYKLLKEKKFSEQALKKITSVYLSSLKDHIKHTLDGLQCHSEPPMLKPSDVSRLLENVKQVHLKDDLIEKVVELKKQRKALIKEQNEFDVSQYSTITLLLKSQGKLTKKIKSFNIELNIYGIDPIDTNKLVDEAENKAIKMGAKLLTLPENVIFDTSIFTRSLKRGVKGEDVGKLQEFLGLKVDNDFGPQTEYVLKAYQNRLGYNNPDGELTVAKNKTYKTLKAIQDTIAARSKSKNVETKKPDPVKKETLKKQKNNQKSIAQEEKPDQNQDQEPLTLQESVEQSIQKTEKLTELIENSDDFYKALEAYIDGGKSDDILSHSGSAFGWLREAFGFNKASEYFEKIKGYDITKEQEDIFHEELAKLLPNSNLTTLEQKTNTAIGYGIRDIIIIAAFQDLPILDIRLNFAKKLRDSGVPMDKALEFSNWVKGGMSKENRPDYSAENLKEISGKDALASFQNLKILIAEYGISNQQFDQALTGDLKTLSEGQKKLLKVLIEKRILPDLVTLNTGAFNWLEKWFDDKDDKINNDIRKLQGQKHELGTIADLLGENVSDKKEDKKKKYDVYLNKIDAYYILEVDDWGENSKIVFKSKPNEEQIKTALQDYLKNGTKKSSSWKDTDYQTTEDETVEVIALPGGQYLLKYFDDYHIINHQPEDKDISSDARDSWKPVYIEGTWNTDIAVGEQLKTIGDIIALLKEQAKEGRWLSENVTLIKGIESVESRTEYAKKIRATQKFLEQAISVLSKKANTKEKRDFINELKEIVKNKESLKKVADLDMMVPILNTPTVPITPLFVKRLIETVTGDSKIPDNGNVTIGTDTGQGSGGAK